VLLHDFTPLSSPLILSKILIVIDEPSLEFPAEATAGASDDSQEEKQETPMPSQPEVMDYGKMTENLFFRIYEGTVEEESLIFDQLD